jgi:hypothetical protein
MPDGHQHPNQHPLRKPQYPRPPQPEPPEEKTGWFSLLMTAVLVAAGMAMLIALVTALFG